MRYFIDASGSCVNELDEEMRYAVWPGRPDVYRGGGPQGAAGAAVAVRQHGIGDSWWLILRGGGIQAASLFA